MANQDELDFEEEGLGPDSAGQSGDTQGLSNVASASSESVAELVEEGQFYEAEVVAGVEDEPEGVNEIHIKQRRPGRRAARPLDSGADEQPADSEEQKSA